MAAPFLLIVFATLIAGPILPGDGEQNVQQCVSFVLQRQGANCSCDSIGESCTCNVNGRSRTAHPCRLALFLTASQQSRLRPPIVSQVNAISGRQADENLRPIDLRPRHQLLGTLDGDEEPFYHMSILPRNLDELNTRFFMYFNFNRNDSIELNYNDSSTIDKLPFSSLHVLYVIAHDQNEVNVTQDELYIELKNRLLAVELSSAAIFVDWAVGAEGQALGNSFDDQPAANTIVVGREVALICYQLANRTIIADEDIYFIGNGLGAQMLHFAAKYYTQLWSDQGVNGNPVGLDGPQRKVGRFTALDPTARNFQGFLSNTLVVPHVNRLDATSVDVIHTSCVTGPQNGFDYEDILSGRIGMGIPIGKIDFYPNGCLGKTGLVNHPNCAGDSPRRLRLWCNHQIALYFFIASVSDDPAVEHYMNAFATGKWDNRASVERAISGIAYLRNIMGFNARSDNRVKNLGIFTLPLVLDSGTFLIDQDRTDALMYDTNFEIFRTQRTFHPKFRLPGVDSGQFIDDFPPQKPQGLINLTRLERPTCGQFRPPVQPVPSPRVVEGHLPFANQFPWVVCLIGVGLSRTTPPRYSGWGSVCTGSLLSNRFALFAAHCFEEQKVFRVDPNYNGFAPENWLYYVTFGTNVCMRPTNRNYRRVVFNKNFVFKHEVYDPLVKEGISNWDISLVKLRPPIVLPETYNGGSVNTICWRSTTQFDYGDTTTDLYIAGFGTKSFNASLDNSRLTWITYRTVQADYTSIPGGFEEKVKYDAWPGTWKMKTLERNTLRTTGPGDSGSAIVWYVRTAEDNEVDPSPNVSIYRGVVAGVLSTGVEAFDNPSVDQDGRIATPLTGTKVGVPVFQWLENMIDENTYKVDLEPTVHPFFQRVPPPNFVN